MTIFAILLILGIIFFQAIQGLYSALVMATCTLVATLIAFGYYESLAGALYSNMPAHADGIALMAMLILPLLALRLLLDRFLPGNVVPGMWPDRIGGGLLGLFTALLLVGTLLIGIQMLPFDRSILGYDPYDDDLQPASSLGIDAPAFTLGLVKIVSDGSFSNAEPFALRHDNLLLEMWATRNRPEGAWGGAPPEAMTVLGLYEIQEAKKSEQPQAAQADEEARAKIADFLAGVPAYPTAPQATKGQSRVLVTRVSVADEGVTDSDGWWRLMGTHFRLVAEDGESFYPVGYLINAGGWRAITGKVGLVRIDRHVSGKGQQDKPKRGSKKKDASTTEKTRKAMLVVDLLYRVPHAADGEPRKLRFMTFRRRLAKGGKLPEITEVTALAELAADQGGPSEALTVNKAIGGKVEIEAPEGQHPFIPTRAEVASKPPLELAIDDDAPLKAEATKAKPYHLTYFSGKEPVKTLERGKKEIQSFHEPLVPPEGEDRVQWRAVQLTGKVPDASAMGKLFAGLAATTVQPQVQYEHIPGQIDTRAAAGAWVEWREQSDTGKDPVYWMHMCYTTKLDLLTDLSRGSNPDIGQVLQTYAKQSQADNVTKFGLVFLVPENATVLGFRLTGGGPVYKCTPPLVVVPKD